jgi:hypothetical protein
MTPVDTVQAQQSDVIADYANDLRQMEMEQYEAGVRKARKALFWAGGLIFVGELISMYSQGFGMQPLLLVFAVLEAGIFIALGFWTKKKPYTAVLSGLIAFIGIILFSVVVNGMVEGGAGVVQALFSGIIVKVAILVNLILPLKDAKALQAARGEQL